MRTLDGFREIVLVDFEYYQHAESTGHAPPIPLCACALEVRSGRQHRLWQGALRTEIPPWPHGADTLFISYSAPAELSCYLELGWPLPRYVLDLLIEHRHMVNGVLDKKLPRDLLSALRYHGLSGIEALEKKEWRDLILTGGPFTPEQRDGILDYCWGDVASELTLLKAMRSRLPLDIDGCLYRGRYAVAATLGMRPGIPIDVQTWQQFLDNRERILHEIVRDCSIYEGTTFKLDRFSDWLNTRGLLNMWPRTNTRQLEVRDRAFRDLSHIRAVEQLRQIRAVVDQLRTPSFQVYQGRNSFSILPFKTETSRNSTIGCIFQAPAWLRGLVQPPPGKGLIYIDYEQEEFFIGGVLAGDKAMQEAYTSGDPYTPFAIEAGLIPRGGTKQSHPVERAVAKTGMLAIQYGIGAPSLARKLGVSLNRAEDLLSAHRRLFPKFWAWSGVQVQRARWMRHIETEYGWQLTANNQTKTGTLLNFKIQGCGAEILRLASIFLMESSLSVICPVHDAFLLECNEDDMADVVAEASRQMIRASEYVLGGYRLRVESRSLRYPDRLFEPRGKSTWDHVLDIASRINPTTYSVGRSVARSVGRSVTSP